MADFGTSISNCTSYDLFAWSLLILEFFVQKCRICFVIEYGPLLLEKLYSFLAMTEQVLFFTQSALGINSIHLDSKNGIVETVL